MNSLILSVIVFAAVLPSLGSIAHAQAGTTLVTPDKVGERDGVMFTLNTGSPFDGTITHLSPTGQIERSIEYRKGRTEGFVQVYDSQGKVVVRESWLEGVRNGLSEEFYPNGQLKKRVRFLAGHMSGEYRIYDEAGNLRISGTYVQSLKAGYWVVYSSDSEIVERVRFQNGVLKSEIIDEGDIEREYKARHASRPSK